MDHQITRRGDNTRTAIILGAHELFVRQGYHGTSMRQIAHRAGVALGGIYNHFASKEDIFRHVFFAYHPYNDVLPALQSAKGETIADFVRDAAHLMVAALNKRPDFLKLMFIEIVEFNSIHTNELFSTLLPQSLKIVERILQSGENIRPIPAPILLRSFLGLFLSYYLTEIIIETSSHPEFGENAIDYFVDIYLHGILRPGQD